MDSKLNLSIEDAHYLLGAVISRALRDVEESVLGQQEDAEQFLDHLCPLWRTYTPSYMPRRRAKHIKPH